MSFSRVITAEEIPDLDAVFYVAGFCCPPQILTDPDTRCYELLDSPIGPTLADLNNVIAFLNEWRAVIDRPLRIGAYGGARLLAATALSVGLAERPSRLLLIPQVLAAQYGLAQMVAEWFRIKECYAAPRVV